MSSPTVTLEYEAYQDLLEKQNREKHELFAEYQKMRDSFHMIHLNPESMYDRDVRYFTKDEEFKKEVEERIAILTRRSHINERKKRKRVDMAQAQMRKAIEKRDAAVKLVKESVKVAEEYRDMYHKIPKWVRLLFNAK